jgi:hypothetical protein
MAEDQRTHVIQIRVKSREKEDIERVAAQEDLTVSAWARRLLLAEVRKKEKK